MFSKIINFKINLKLINKFYFNEAWPDHKHS